MIKVLVVDDSVLFRSQIKNALTEIPGVEVVGVAANGHIAIGKLTQLSVDVMTLDLEMPEMDGLSTLREMQRLGIQTKTIVFSSKSKRGSELALEALHLGAIDFVAKPSGEDMDANPDQTPVQAIKNVLASKIYALLGGATQPVAPLSKFSIEPGDRYPRVDWMNFKPKVLVVGASTGGPSSLEKVFSELTGPYQIPVIVVQHMPPVFTEAFASRLGKIVGVPAAEAKHDELLVPNRIYVAPGDYHLTLEMSDRGVKLCLDQGPHRNSVRPAVDPLFESAARIFGKDCLGLVMTGMGYDGKVGAEAIKTEGGAVMIQSPESCIVYGMPAAVKESGAFDRCLDLEDIAANLCRHLCSPASGQGSPASGQGSPSSSQEVRTA